MNSITQDMRFRLSVVLSYYVGLQLMCYKQDKQKARGPLYLSSHTKKGDLLHEQDKLKICAFVYPLFSLITVSVLQRPPSVTKLPASSFIFGSIGITMMISVSSPIRIQCVQTDNGSEFANRLRSAKKTLFEEALKANGIDYHPIRPAMPRHNGKVERSHREDQKRLYDKTTFYSLQDADTQLKKYLKKSNNRPMRPLGYLSPNDMISILLNV